jgi:hypothetical protein
VVVQERTETLMQIAVSAVDRVGNESEKAVVKIQLPVAAK